jgi:hypothetical protein
MRGGKTWGGRKKMQKESDGRFKGCKKEGVRNERGK